ncbi:Major facilitator super domain-containing protein 12 [Homalodisca vitripennis]|nr:Major facilitator super domain-containing protein 12 [Homalodisca vitripennis]
MMSCPPRYNSLTGKVMKRKEQYYRHIWMPVEESTAKDYLEKQFSWKGNMENGLKFNSRLTKESTPLVLVNDRKLPFSQKLAYGLGHFYNDICAAIWFTYALIFLQLVAEMGPVNAGFLLFIVDSRRGVCLRTSWCQVESRRGAWYGEYAFAIYRIFGQVVDAITTPVAGYLLDRTVNRKRWHLVGSLLVLVSFPLIFTTPGAVMGASIWVQMVYFSLSISVFQVGWAVVQIAHLSLLPELTTLTEERAQLTAHSITPAQSVFQSGLAVVQIAHLSLLPELTILTEERAQLTDAQSVFQSGWAVMQIAHLSRLPELTTLTEERAKLTVHVRECVTDMFLYNRYTASMAAHILVYFVAWALLSSSHAMNMKLVGPSDSWRFLDLAIVTSVIGLIVTMVFHSALKTTRGLFPRLPRKQEILSLQAKSLKFFRSPHLYSVAVIYTSSRLFMTLSLVYIPLFINETVLSQVGTLATVPLASFLVSAFAALIVKLCSVHCGGLRITYLIGSAFCLLGCVLVHFSYSKTDDTSKVFGVAILFGAGSSITMVVSLCVTANLIGLDTECGAFVYSTVTFADKLLNGLAVIIIEEMKCANTADCPYYYGGVLSYVNIGVVFCGLTAVKCVNTADCPYYYGGVLSYVNSGVVFCGLAVVFMLPTELFAATNTK